MPQGQRRFQNTICKSAGPTKYRDTFQAIALSPCETPYFGIQYRGEDKRPKAPAALRQIVGSFSEAYGPKHYDLNQHRDADGYENLIAVAYWRDPAAYQKWLSSEPVSSWWSSDDRLKDGIGYFREIVSPRAEQFEALYAFKDMFPGVGAIMDRISDEIQEHGYWGSMRDRIPLSQTDRMQPVGDLKVRQGNPQLGGRVIIRGHDNVALIRSGQDWAETESAERKLYLEEMEPTLRAGMDFLRDNGKEFGCYSNRSFSSLISMATFWSRVSISATGDLSISSRLGRNRIRRIFESSARSFAWRRKSPNCDFIMKSPSSTQKIKYTST
jgi:heme-containing dehydratase-like protein